MNQIKRNKAKEIEGILQPLSGANDNIVFQKNGRIRMKPDKVSRKRK